ncbi:hypothetical protein MHYP_G00270590 [Metynnis hypsauchen]
MSLATSPVAARWSQSISLWGTMSLPRSSQRIINLLAPPVHPARAPFLIRLPQTSSLKGAKVKKGTLFRWNETHSLSSALYKLYTARRAGSVRCRKGLSLEAEYSSGAAQQHRVT